MTSEPPARLDSQPPLAAPSGPTEPTEPTEPNGPTALNGPDHLLPGVALAFAAAGVALAVNRALPTLSALLLAILLGVAMANTVGVPSWSVAGLAVAARRGLRVGIVLLGLQLSLVDIAGLGWGMVGVVVLVVGGGILGAEVFGRALGVAPALRLLIACGFSICGAAAVAAVEGVVDDKEREDAVTALALVVVFGTLMIAVVPVASGALGLGDRVGGLWAGAAIHEVAQVVAAAGIIGSGALQVGVVVKLARVLMLAPVIAGIGLVRRRRGAPEGDGGTRPPLVPLFVVGFLAAALVRTVGVLPAPALEGLQIAQAGLLAAAMFALGTGVRVAQLRTVGGRAVLLGVLATGWVAALALGGVLLAS